MTYTVEDVARGLKALRDSLRTDVEPILELSIDRQEGGYFMIPREVFSCVDYLGALYSGYREAGGRRREIATTEKAVKFLAEIFGRLDPVYARHGELAYSMYRHGTVHLQRPNRLKRADGAIIEWALYKGERQGAPIRHPTHPIVNHLEPHVLDTTAKTYLLPLSINVLFVDLMNAIIVYRDEVKTRTEQGDATLLNNYSATMDALLLPDDTTLTW